MEIKEIIVQKLHILNWNLDNILELILLVEVLENRAIQITIVTEVLDIIATIKQIYLEKMFNKRDTVLKNITVENKVHIF